MSVVVPAVLAVVLIVAALGGPVLVRSASPLLMRVPRAAVVLLVGSLLLWLLAVASLSLMLAWMFTGPSLLPAPLADFCRRCLEAASPLGSGTVDTAIPIVLLLLLPALALLALTGLGAPRWLRRSRTTRAVSRAIVDGAQRTRVAGYDVVLVPDPRAIAFSLPRRSGGIVISEGLCATFEPDELAAVLEHERAHLRQRHHVILALLDAVTWPLRRVPLVSTIASAIPHYLEIAADDAARNLSGTPALASALLKLGAPNRDLSTSPDLSVTGSMLHAAGPDRIGHIVAPSRVRSAVLPASTLAIQLVAFILVVAAVHGPYVYAVLTGCPLPA